MEKSGSLIRQVIGHKMFFVVFLLFPTDILVEVVAITNETIPGNATASLNLSASPFPASSTIPAEISTTTVPSFPNDTMSDSTSSITQGEPAPFLNATPPVSQQELQSATSGSTAVPSSPLRSKVIDSVEEKHPRTEATELQESQTPPVQKEVPSKMTVRPHFGSGTVSSPTKDLGTRSFIEQSSSAIAYPKTTKSTEPKDDKKGRRFPGQVPVLTQSPENVSHYMPGPFTTSTTPINNAPVSDTSDKSPAEKKSPVIILVVVFSILLLVSLLVFLYFRRRRHSGSTSFNSPEWAGQATLPDDTGLDNNTEQQVGSAGEGETRRGTLVTFFGKRQSRVPSIAMEDVNGKGGKEETEQLLCGEAEIGSPSEAIGDANGKVPESPASNKLGESPS